MLSFFYLAWLPGIILGFFVVGGPGLRGCVVGGSGLLGDVVVPKSLLILGFLVRETKSLKTVLKSLTAADLLIEILHCDGRLVVVRTAGNLSETLLLYAKLVPDHTN